MTQIIFYFNFTIALEINIKFNKYTKRTVLLKCQKTRIETELKIFVTDH